jgi:hypothetical protein
MVHSHHGFVLCGPPANVCWQPSIWLYMWYSIICQTQILYGNSWALKFVWNTWYGEFRSFALRAESACNAARCCTDDIIVKNIIFCHFMPIRYTFPFPLFLT